MSTSRRKAPESNGHHGSSGREPVIDSRLLPSLKVIVASEGTRQLITILLASSGPVVSHTLRSGIARNCGNAVRALLDSEVIYSMKKGGRSLTYYQLEDEWREFFIRHATKGSKGKIVSFQNFVAMLGMLNDSQNAHILAWLPSLLEGGKRQSELFAIRGVPSAATKEGPKGARDWVNKQYALFMGMLSIGGESDPIVLLQPKFEQWFRSMMDDLYLLIGDTLTDEDTFSDDVFEDLDVDVRELDEVFQAELRLIQVDPALSTNAKPGSEEKVATLAARYAAGKRLWNPDDRYDHGPGSVGNLVVQPKDPEPSENYNISSSDDDLDTD